MQVIPQPVSITSGTVVHAARYPEIVLEPWLNQMHQNSAYAHHRKFS